MGRKGEFLLHIYYANGLDPQRTILSLLIVYNLIMSEELDKLLASVLILCNVIIFMYVCHEVVIKHV